MARKSPVMEKAQKYIDTHKRITPKILEEKLGISKASAYNAYRKLYLKDSVKKEHKKSYDKNKPKKPKVKMKAPDFTLEGIHFENDGAKSEGKLTWSHVVYIGVCPVCLERVSLYKAAIMFSSSGVKEISQDYRGKCSKCDISIIIHRSR